MFIIISIEIGNKMHHLYISFTKFQGNQTATDIGRYFPKNNSGFVKAAWSCVCMKIMLLV